MTTVLAKPHARGHNDGPADEWPLIETRELHVHYGQSHVLQGVSFTIRRGESVGLLGRNGMGKTTLIRALLGLVPISGGCAFVAGLNVSGSRTEHIVRRGMGVVPEGRGIFPNLSVRENLLMGERSRAACGIADRFESSGQTPEPWNLGRVLRLFPRLAERLENGGQQLSGGEQQMLAIGRALMTNPRIIVLDEATEGLAPLVVAEIWHVISMIRASGIASLVVDRNYRAILSHTDRCVVLEKGRIVMQDLSAQLIKDGQSLHRYLGV